MIFKRMSFSFLWILDIFENKYENIIQLLVVSVDKRAFLLKWFDEFLNQYWARRIRNRLAHSRVYEEERVLTLIETSTTSDMNDDQKWFLITFNNDLEESERCHVWESRRRWWYWSNYDVRRQDWEFSVVLKNYRE